MRDLTCGRWAIVAVLAALLFSACSSRESPAGTPTATAAGATTPAVTPSPSPLPSSTPAATSTSTVSPSPPPATPTSVPVGPSVAIEHGPRDSGAVALTFDMGGRVDPALDIVNWLIANRVPATIFMTGAMAANENTDAGRQVLALADAHPDLFALGNHSYTHTDFRELDAAAMEDELLRTEQAVSPYTSLSMRPLFRPPYGGVDDSVLAGVGEAGYAYTILWDVDTIDWLPEAEGGDSAEEMVAKVTTSAQGGSIVLMHLGGYNTFEALPGVVEGLRARGFTFARVPEFLPR